MTKAEAIELLCQAWEMNLHGVNWDTAGITGQMDEAAVKLGKEPESLGYSRYAFCQRIAVSMNRIYKPPVCPLIPGESEPDIMLLYDEVEHGRQ